MKFIESGPDIPDELLLALDEGRVVFFCGAGVSLADASLPDFFDLADKVRTTLGDLDDSSAAKILTKAHEAVKILTDAISAIDIDELIEAREAVKILTEAREMISRTSVPGLISADRVFGLLERDFLECDIERAVAKALAPQKGVDLWAHELLLDLATTRDGVTKLVTTNFDRLFDDCRSGLKTWQPPRLPDPARPGDMNGVVYLHGRATENYDGAEGDGFVLSSAEFGRAYLAEGWATRFFKDVIDRYSVVFVSYRAEDPPVQYLLEGLSKSNGRLDKVYAFHPGDTDDAASRWGHKGVRAIPYDSKDGDHAALWDTLKEWAERAKDPEGWREKIISMARGGPESLAPFEREQVAHLVSTKDGARKFLESDPPAPATWLCVFDPSIRYSEPGRDKNGYKMVNPFDRYGLAGDVVPAPISQDNHTGRRETPSTAWDAFALNRRDRLELRDEHVTPLRGDASLYAGRLPDRINYLGGWISRISKQNAAVWWGSRQSGLHESIQRQIRQNLKRSDTECAPNILHSWQCLFEYWRIERDESQYDCSRFSNELKAIGWNKEIIQKYEELSRPRLTERNYITPNVVPPQVDEETNLEDLMWLEPTYNKETWAIQISDERLAEVVSTLNRNLGIGVQLETECGGYSYMMLPTIISSKAPDTFQSERKEGLPGAVLFYTTLFERLLNLDVEKARQETATWSIDDNIVFARLRIWASRFQTLVPDEDFDEFFGRVSREAFWKGQHQRDLLHTLQQRWAKLPVSATRRLTERILEGPERRNNEPKQDFAKRRAAHIIERLSWLRIKGCIPNINDQEYKQLQNAVPDRKPEYAEDADRSWETRLGIVRTDSECSTLLSEQLPKVLAKAQEISGRTGQELVDYDPFRGLSTDHPVRALSSLRREAKRGEYPEWAWRKFLHSESRKDDKPRFKNFIAELLVSASDEALKGIIRPVSEWFLSVTDDLAEECVPIFERLITRLLNFLSDNPDAGDSGLVRDNRDPSWAAEALNSPAGNIAQALYRDPRRNNLAEKQGLPAEWRILVDDLLALPGDNGRIAMVFSCYLLNWFYYIDPEWTKEKLLSVLQSNDTGTLEAWWSGYLWGVRELPSLELFQILKPHLLGKAAGQTSDEWNICDKLAWLVLENWDFPDARTDAERISDDEFREALLKAGYRFRSRVLSLLELWSEGDNEHGKFWKPLRERLLRQVWPKQKEARTPQDSARLIEFAFSDEESFVAVSNAILPLIGKIERDIEITLPPFGKGGFNIVYKHPCRVLEILDRALSESANNWPYEIGEILERIVDADPSLRKDTRWIELSRRWNSR